MFTSDNTLSFYPSNITEMKTIIVRLYHLRLLYHIIVSVDIQGVGNCLCWSLRYISHRVYERIIQIILLLSLASLMAHFLKSF